MLSWCLKEDVYCHLHAGLVQPMLHVAAFCRPQALHLHIQLPPFPMMLAAEVDSSRHCWSHAVVEVIYARLV